MFSVPDIAIIGVLALLLFGPDRLPGMMRRAGRLMRDVQNTSQSFIAEMERAADVHESHYAPPRYESAADEPIPEVPFGALRPPEPAEPPLETGLPASEIEPAPAPKEDVGE